MSTKHFFKLLVFLPVSIVAVYLIAQTQSCIPSVLQEFSNSPAALRCGTSDESIVNIGNRTTTVISYQPSINQVDGIYNNIGIVYEAEADVEIGNYSVQSEVTIPGKLYVREEYDTFGELVNSQNRFVPYDRGGIGTGRSNNGSGTGSGGLNAGGQDFGEAGNGLGNESETVFPNSVSNQVFYLDSGDGAGNEGCLSSYDSGCIEDTYVEGVEFNPDLKTIYVSDNQLPLEQDSYQAPKSIDPQAHDEDQDVADEGTDSSDGPSGEEEDQSSGSNHYDARQDRIDSWRATKAIESYQRFKDSYKRAEQKQEEYLQERARQFQEYERQIKAISQRSQAVNQRSEAILKDINNLIKNFTPDELKAPAAKEDWYSNKKNFEYNKMSDQALNITKARLNKAREGLDAIAYEKHARDILNTQNGVQVLKGLGVVNDSGVLLAKSFNPNLSNGPIEQYSLSEIESDHNKRILRDLGNKYQVKWIQSGGLEHLDEDAGLIYAAGVSLYDQALQAALLGDNEALLAYVESSAAFLKASWEFRNGIEKGLLDFAYDMATAIPNLLVAVAENYQEFPTTKEEWVNLSNAVIAAAPQVKKALTQAVIDYKNDFKYGSPERKGEIVGLVIGEVVSTFVPATKLTKLGKVGKIAGSADNLADLSKAAGFISDATGRAIKALPEIRGGYIDDIVSGLSKSQSGELTSNAGRIVDVLVNESSEDVLHTMNKVIASTRSIDPRPLGYNKLVSAATDFDEFDDVLNVTKRLDGALEGVPGIKVEGIVARYTAKDVLPTGKSPLDRHSGNLFDRGRYSIGGANGVDVLSYGYGKNPIQALSVASKEARVLIPGVRDFISDHSRVSFDNILDLTNESARSKFGMNFLGDSYTETNILGALAEKKGYTGILAPSAQKEGGVVLHIFNGGLSK